MTYEYPDHWVVLVDKGYQGAADVLRAVIPQKKPVRGIIPREDELCNKKFSSVRILVENYSSAWVNCKTYVSLSTFGLRRWTTIHSAFVLRSQTFILVYTNCNAMIETGIIASIIARAKLVMQVSVSELSPSTSTGEKVQRVYM